MKICMIVAHFDDEIIFGGNELLKNINDEYTVIVCTTKKGLWKNKFDIIMDKLNVRHTITFNYKDSEDKNINVFNNLQNKLTEIIIKNNFDKIITHSKCGEYGHIQHKQIHNIVINLFFDLNIPNSKIFVFSLRDYNKKDECYDQKINLLNIYFNNNIGKFILSLVNSYGNILICTNSNN